MNKVVQRRLALQTKLTVPESEPDFASMDEMTRLMWDIEKYGLAELIRQTSELPPMSHLPERNNAPAEEAAAPLAVEIEPAPPSQPQPEPPPAPKPEPEWWEEYCWWRPRGAQDHHDDGRPNETLHEYDPFADDGET